MSTTTEHRGGRSIRRKHRAHRYGSALVHGPIPPALLVLHRCDHAPCCNPAHLYLGTAADNARDRDGPERRELLRRRRLAGAGQEPLLGFGRLAGQ